MTFGSLIKRVLRPLIKWYRAVVTPDTHPSSSSSIDPTINKKPPQEDRSASRTSTPKAYFASDDEITVTQVIDSRDEGMAPPDEPELDEPESDELEIDEPEPGNLTSDGPAPDDAMADTNQAETPISNIDTGTTQEADTTREESIVPPNRLEPDELEAEEVLHLTADDETSGAAASGEQVVDQAEAALNDESINIDMPKANNETGDDLESTNGVEAAGINISRNDISRNDISHNDGPHNIEEASAKGSTPISDADANSADVPNTVLENTTEATAGEADKNNQADLVAELSEPIVDSDNSSASAGEHSVDVAVSDDENTDDANTEIVSSDNVDETSEDADPEAAESDGEDEQVTSGKPPQPLRLLQIDEQPVTLLTLVESLLFVAETAAEPKQFAEVLDVPLEDVQAALDRLSDDYVERGSGIRLQERNGKYTLVSMPLAAQPIEDFLNLDLNSRLSSAALETLAIVAYRQPVTRIQVESIRGVDCGGVLRTLLQRELITEVGRLDAVGRPILYGVTDLFMQHFGLTTMDELPSLETTDADLLWAATQLADDDDADATSGADENGSGNDNAGADNNDGVESNDDADNSADGHDGTDDNDDGSKEVNSHE